MTAEIEPMPASLATLIGLPCSQIWHFGPKFDFGTVDESGYGEYSLWCAGPSWRLQMADEWIGSADDDDGLDRILLRFIGRCVTRCRVGPYGDLWIELDGDASISVFVTEHFIDYNDPWILYCPEEIISVVSEPPYLLVEAGSLRRESQQPGALWPRRPRQKT